MLLRRITEHVKAQNWTAVALDLVIVVVGVFIGIQVANLNEARKETELAETTLEYLQEDFVSINETATSAAAFYENTIREMDVLLDSLAKGEVSPEDEDDIKEAINSGGSFADPPPPSGTYRDLLSSGKLSLIRDKELRLRLIEYEQSLQNIVESDLAITNSLIPFAYAFARHAVVVRHEKLPDYKDATSFYAAQSEIVLTVDFDAILSDPEFRLATDQHRQALLDRYANLSVARNKIAEIQKLIDKTLEVN